MMERLTYVDDEGTILFTPDGCDFDNCQTIRQLADNQEYECLEEIAERLANREQVCENFEKKIIEFDSLYLEKCEEVNKLKAENETLKAEGLAGLEMAQVYVTLNHFKTLKEQGRLIELPCKIGDTVYEPRSDRNMISEYEIQKIIIGIYGPSFFKWNLISGIYSNIGGFPVSSLGKLVFLTREEAEKKLKESEAL